MDYDAEAAASIRRHREFANRVRCALWGAAGAIWGGLLWLVLL